MKKNHVKKIAKQIFHLCVPTSLPPILIASMGRSGSTVVYSAVREGLARHRFPAILRGVGAKIISDGAWDIHNKTFNGGAVYKTHALAHELNTNSDLRVVFVFGSATDAALSVLACKEKYGEDWIKLHFEHLRASGTFDELGSKDVLRFADQLSGWLGLTGTRRLILHYDALWDHADTLSDFIGVPVVLPVRKDRLGAKLADESTRQQFKQTYAALDEQIAKLPKCQILE